MKTVRLYSHLPSDALDIRIKVFVDEQGFVDEVDPIDEIASHLVLFLEDVLPIATCRIFPDKDDPSTYYLGRLAVLRAHRGQSIGRQLLLAAEEHIISRGGERVLLHSQASAAPFYEKCGYRPCAAPDEEQGCPHIWMKKTVAIRIEEPPVSP